MLEDALSDLTDRGDVVIDPFLGSGSTLMAAHRTGRVCRGVELDPHYVDVVARRFEAATGLAATHVATGETFSAFWRFGENAKRSLMKNTRHPDKSITAPKSPRTLRSW